MRKEYYADLKAKSFYSLDKARTKRPKIDWAHQNIVKPTFLGPKAFVDYDLASLVEYIDWDPFFQTW